MTVKRTLLAAVLVIVVLVSVALVIVARYDYDKLKPQIENAFKESTGRALVLRGKLDLHIGLSPTLVVNDASIGNASWGSRPGLAEIKRLEVQVSLVPLLFRRLEVKRLVLINPDILVETNPAGETNLDFLKKVSTGSEKKESATGRKVEFGVNEMRIKNGHLEYKNGKTGAKYVVLLEHFDASASGSRSPLKLSLNGAYNGAAFSVTGTVVPLASLSDTSVPWPFNVNILVAGLNATLVGTVRNAVDIQGLDIKVTAKSADLGRIGVLWGGTSPLKGPFEMSARVADLRPKAFGISDLKIVAAGSDVGGSLEADFGKSRLLITAGLQSRKIDLRAFAEKEPSSPKATPSSSRIFPDTPLPMSALQMVDLSVNLKAAEVFTSQVALHDLNARVVLDDGRLSVKPLTAVIGGGKLDGRVDLDSRGKAAELSTLITVTQLDVGSMLKELKKGDTLEGRMDVRINLTGKGASVAQLMSGLNGMVYAIMGQGKINNRYLKILGSDLGSDIFRMINPFHKDLPTTAVSCLVCGFKMTGGIAETTAFVINSDYMSVVGNGTVNLRTEGLDFSLKPVPKEGIGTGIAGKLTMSLGELTRPFKLAGTLAHPSLAIDFRQTAIAAGKAIGGFMLLGPAGLGGALLGSNSGEKELCPLAVRAAQQGVKLSAVEKGQDKGVVGKTTQGIEKGIGAVEKGLKSIFGK
jgi:AsmA family protein